MLEHKVLLAVVHGIMQMLPLDTGVQVKVILAEVVAVAVDGMVVLGEKEPVIMGVVVLDMCILLHLISPVVIIQALNIIFQIPL